MEHHLKKFSEIHNKRVKGFSPEAVKIIKSYNWPGNIRELMNCIESAVVMTLGDRITVDSLPPFLSFAPAKQTAGGTTGSLEEIEKKVILDSLAGVGGNKAEAAKKLGIGLRTLYRKLEKWGVE
jgi:two-component system response regulator HydG